MFRTSRPQGLVQMLAVGFLIVAIAVRSLAEPTPEIARQRIFELRAQIKHHDALYFQKAAPEISDAAYDALKRELRDLEQTYPAEAKTAVLADDHTDGFTKVVHRVPMLSLEKAYTETELRAFCDRIAKSAGDVARFVIEPKIDGLSVNAVYKNGRFESASTRGSGREGDDITANALMIRPLPRALRTTKPDGTANNIPTLIELRGEIYLSHAEFNRLNRERYAEGEPPLSHPRNAAVGTIKSRDPNETAERHLDIVFYGFGTCEPANATPASQQALHAQLHDWGLPVLETFTTAKNTDEVWAAVRSLGQRRDKLAAPIDGAVIKLDDVASRTQFGDSAEGPRWAIAYKYPPERVATQLRAITLQVGRTGVLTPVAELAPVELAGSTIARASLHNREQIARLDLRLGDTVYLEKAGEIIPEIVGVDLTRRPAMSSRYAFPPDCPSCHTPVVNEQDISAVRCPNFDCPAQRQRLLSHFASKAGVNIVGLGDSTLAELIARDLIRNAADFYGLQKSDLLKIPGLGEKSTDQLLSSIARSRQAELWRFIHGLGIPQVGPATAKTLALRFHSLEKLAAAKRDDLPPALGSSTIDAVEAFIGRPENRALLLALDKVVQPTQVAAHTNDLSGKIFVLTGRLQTLSRDETIRRIEAAGGLVRDSVGKATSYVVAGENAGEKLTKAKALNIPVIDEGELLRLLANPPPPASAQ
ncbi:MAG: NAD-dependent DNA ligase LigA [Nibricoccus sp.]